LVIADTAARPVEKVLADLVGGVYFAGATTLDAALVPEPPLAGAILNGRTLVFLGAPLHGLIGGAMPALEGRLRRAFRGAAVLALHLRSTDNSYGWASWAPDGQLVRARLGNVDGIARDVGAPLRTEREALAGYRDLGHG